MNTETKVSAGFIPCTCGFESKHGHIVFPGQQKHSPVIQTEEQGISYLNYILSKEYIDQEQYDLILGQVESFFEKEINKKILIGNETGVVA